MQNSSSLMTSTVEFHREDMSFLHGTEGCKLDHADKIKFARSRNQLDACISAAYTSKGNSLSFSPKEKDVPFFSF